MRGGWAGRVDGEKCSAQCPTRFTESFALRATTHVKTGSGYPPRPGLAGLSMTKSAPNSGIALAQSCRRDLSCIVTHPMHHTTYQNFTVAHSTTHTTHSHHGMHPTCNEKKAHALPATTQRANVDHSFFLFFFFCCVVWHFFMTTLPCAFTLDRGEDLAFRSWQRVPTALALVEKKTLY